VRPVFSLSNRSSKPIRSLSHGHQVRNQHPRQPRLSLRRFPRDFLPLRAAQFAYSVDLAGQRDKLFATPGLHHKLQEAGLRAGSVFTITKIEIEGNRKDWRIEGEEAPAPVAVVQQEKAQPNGKAGSNGHT